MLLATRQKGSLYCLGDLHKASSGWERSLPSKPQIKPVRFTVQAIVTTSDLEITPSEINFGYCTIYEAIRTEIRLSNLSLLPQEFGFVGLPKVPAMVSPGDMGWDITAALQAQVSATLPPSIPPS